MAEDKITLLYDGSCPFCKREVDFLKRKDKDQCLAFEDITSAEFDPKSYGKTHDELMGVIHAKLPSGEMVTKVEVFRQAYRAIGMSWLVAPTSWPILRNVFDFLYICFAKVRAPLGRLFGRNCEEVCR